MSIIDGLYEQAKTELIENIAHDLQYDIDNLLTRITAAKNKIDDATRSLREYSRLHEAAKRLQKSMQKSGFNIKTVQDMVTNFEAFGSKNRSQIFSNTEKGKENLQHYINLQNASDSVLQNAQEQEAKQALLEGYKLIMGIREALGFKHINYGIIYTGINGSGQQQLLMGTMDIETLISLGHLNNSMSIVLEQTGAQIRAVLNGFDSNQENNNFIDLLSRGNNSQTWSILTEISSQLNQMRTEDGKRKYYYFYGQLVEALMDLEKENLTVDKIYEALIQGQNTISFEKMGDFQLSITEEELSRIYEIQAKTFAAQKISDKDIKTIRITSLANITTTLTHLQDAFSQQNIIEALKKQFTHDPNNKTSRGQIAKLASADKEVEEEIKKLIERVLNSLTT